ncbi:hypothetical protein OUZ56_028807 [Daphnia magna]|uniref:Uncharacterized protein n=1 Tax=Daphnia magna TaxID=35525 RepID=A0ABR0B505_9CRUS|nr:hypothetical protein OUZ56_028807 [Daphnia magna]
MKSGESKASAQKIDVNLSGYARWYASNTNQLREELYKAKYFEYITYVEVTKKMLRFGCSKMATTIKLVHLEPRSFTDM